MTVYYAMGLMVPWAANPQTGYASETMGNLTESEIEGAVQFLMEAGYTVVRVFPQAPHK